MVVSDPVRRTQEATMLVLWRFFNRALICGLLLSSSRARDTIREADTWRNLRACEQPSWTLLNHAQVHCMVQAAAAPPLKLNTDNPLPHAVDRTVRVGNHHTYGERPFISASQVLCTHPRQSVRAYVTSARTATADHGDIIVAS